MSLDHPYVTLPAGLSETVSGLDRGGIVRAARACAEVLQEIGPRLAIGEFAVNSLPIQ